MTMTRFSRQREAIMQALRSRSDHPTAETLYHALRETHPNISLGTVYRNLALLDQMEEIIRLPGQNSPDRYDGTTSPHDHLLCRGCGGVDDLPDMGAIVDLGLVREIAARQHMAVEGYRIVFDGLCKACRP